MWGRVMRVNHAVTKGEKCRQGVARQSCQEEVHGDTPARPCRYAGPGLYDRQPEEKARCKKYPYSTSCHSVE